MKIFRNPKTFYLAVFLWITFELLRSYLIMPFPGSQRLENVAIAHGLHQSRIFVRILLGALLIASGYCSWPSLRASQKIGFGIASALLIAICYITTGPMTAEAMFLPLNELKIAAKPSTILGTDPLIVGVVLQDANGKTQARAYPLQMIGYHHQLRDNLAGTEIMVTYCTVCRTGRVFSPMVDGKLEQFRLVGMNRFNALFEDARTGSWWRQSTGRAIVGARKGQTLPEITSMQLSWSAWKQLHPNSTIAEASPLFESQYIALAAFSNGTNKSQLTGRNHASWADKSWVIGLKINGQAHAFDWNALEKGAVRHTIGGVPVVGALAPDGLSFYFVDARDAKTHQELALSLSADGREWIDAKSGHRWALSGAALRMGNGDEHEALHLLPSSQEFWHSWQTFQPGTNGP